MRIYEQLLARAARYNKLRIIIFNSIERDGHGGDFLKGSLLASYIDSSPPRRCGVTSCLGSGWDMDSVKKKKKEGAKSRGCRQNVETVPSADAETRPVWIFSKHNEKYLFREARLYRSLSDCVCSPSPHAEVSFPCSWKKEEPEKTW